jgi:hypothetical protein
MSSGLAMFFALLFSGSALYPEAPALGIGAGIVGIGGAIAAARAYWASSTRKVRERISAVMDAVGESLGQSDTISARGEIGDGAVASEPDASVVGDAER